MTEQIDRLGAPYTVETIDLAPAADGPAVASLVRRPAEGPAEEGAKGAVLHLHGFADYFFHTEYAEWWSARGYDFHALDLRRYGRSMREHQLPNYTDDVREYFEEIDAAWERIAARGHRRVVLSAHSTGGLVGSLWAHDRQPETLAATVLNSPWLELQGPLWLRTIGTLAIKQLGARVPTRVVRDVVEGIYGRTLHRDHEGEWDYELSWKPLDSWPVYAGWLRAIRAAHAELHRGLSVPGPILVLTSAASATPSVIGPDAHSHDIVLEVAQIRRWAPALGPHVTVVSIRGARHDVVLSVPEVRSEVYAELDRWVAAYAG